jgi:hypothetical protein
MHDRAIEEHEQRFADPSVSDHVVTDVRIMTEPQQGADYGGELTLAQAAESLGFSRYFRSDHYLPTPGQGAPAATDARITLAGLARETSTIRIWNPGLRGDLPPAGGARRPGCPGR